MCNNSEALRGLSASNLNANYTKSPWDRLQQLGKKLKHPRLETDIFVFEFLFFLLCRFLWSSFQLILSGDAAQLAEGCSKPACPNLDLADVKQKIQDSELVVICLGTGRSTQYSISEEISLK